MAIACAASIGLPLLPAGLRHTRATSRRAWDSSSCCYLPDLLPRSYFQKVLAHYRDLRQHLSEEGPCLATGRLAVACTSGAAWRIFRSSWFRQRLQRVAGLPFRPGKMGKDSPQSLAMEFREYRRNSSMLWHSDQILLDPPQLELVYTLENSSDSVTRWSPSHLHVLRNEIQQVWTAPNSGLLLQAGGAVHMVKEVTVGHRSILKMAFENRDDKPMPIHQP